MSEDLCQNAILDRQQLEEEVAVEAQKRQEREDNEARLEAWEQDYLKQFGSWPEEWMYQERFEADVKAGLVDPPSWDSQPAAERRHGVVTRPMNRPASDR